MPSQNIYFKNETFKKLKQEENMSAVIEDALTQWYTKRAVTVEAPVEVVDKLLTEANQKKLEAEKIIKTIEEKKVDEENKIKQAADKVVARKLNVKKNFADLDVNLSDDEVDEYISLFDQEKTDLWAFAEVLKKRHGL